ncbi:Ribonuclease M5 [Pediococcus damnosus]|uniref:Ribonuclease M5 n=1 Tax=Pediococcus damnosus TaxID=51663 RepID=A0A0R2HL75_9LACO|nr:ribonuclease M5 [Pediococcus damnosus]AMV60702.1 Ribonuclease M5 [Pediococcus damnosus]AMV63306.1 Ribonuclease M5 [Pediococcus damnosus]AMV65017.1 Ribonuclease M5 [Pediococcus damnosus]AMV66796.1 Ribonuclease M5 [Pediococcus damnosus]KJU73869.1 DNA primase [Pediococcus damnosus LMG 28219]
MKKIKEVIVVEGKDDTVRINKAVNADTIETRGSAISEQTIDQIRRLQEERGVIVFTDPDFSGEKIRKTISAAVPDVKHAFLARKDAVPSKKGSLGVEHATPQAIRDALDKVYTEVSDAPQTITRTDLLDANLIAGQHAKQRRMELCEILNIGYVNGKQLLKRLQLFQISDEDFQDAVSKLGQE